MRYGPEECGSGLGLGALDRGDEGEERSGDILVLGGCRDVGAGGHPQRHPVGVGALAGLGEEADVLGGLGIEGGDLRHGEREHRILGDLAGDQHLQGVLVDRRAVVLVPPVALVGLLEALEAAQGRRRVGVVGLVGRVLLSEVRCLLGDVVEVGEDEQL